MTELELFAEAEKAGVSVEYMAMPLNKSMSVFDEFGDFVVMDYSLVWSSQEREHLAHELGHCMTGSFYNPYAKHEIRQKHENRANKWAIERLVPVDKLYDAIRQGYADVWSLSDFFGVSVSFMCKAIGWHVFGNMAEVPCL